MTEEQGLPWSVAKAIVDVVAADAACRAVIPEASPYFVMQDWAGAGRNVQNEVLAFVASTAGAVADVVTNPSGWTSSQTFKEAWARAGEFREQPTGHLAYEEAFWYRQGQAQNCFGIATVTKDAISKAIVQKRLPAWVRAAEVVDRDSPVLFHHATATHFATAVHVGSADAAALHDAGGFVAGAGRRIPGGKSYVFDWQSTLMMHNPLISRSLAEWLNSDDRYRVPFGVFQGWG